MPLVSQVSTISGGWLGKDAGKAGGDAGQNIHGDGVGTDRAGVNPRLILLDGIVIQQIAGLEVVGRVQYQLRVGQDGMDIRRNQVGDVGMDLGLAVELGDAAARSLRFGQAFGGVFLLKQDLPLQIAPFDIVAIDQRQRANPSARQKACDGRSRCSAANDGDMGGE